MHIDEPRLWILARSDLDSLNPGKLAAQVSHAANAMVHQIRKKKKADKHAQALLDEWEKSTAQGFGTCIVLDGINETEIRHIVSEVQKLGQIADVIIDPSYPIRDGKITHLIPLVTCGYVFADTSNSILKDMLSGFNLYK